MKNEYKKAIVELVKIENDIIATSEPGGTNGNGTPIVPIVP